MYKPFDMLAIAGKRWTYTKTIENAHKTIYVYAKQIIDALNEKEESDTNVILVLQLICSAVEASDEIPLQDIVVNEKILEQVNNVLDFFGFQALQGNLFEELETLGEDGIDYLRRLLDDNRELLEPEYGETVMGLIFDTLIIQSNQITQKGYELACVFADKDFDIVPNYQDFLLDF